MNKYFINSLLYKFVDEQICHYSNPQFVISNKPLSFLVFHLKLFLLTIYYSFSNLLLLETLQKL